MGRPSEPDAAAAMGVRAILIEKLAGHVRETNDPRLVLGLEAGEEPADDPEFVDYLSDKIDDLRAGRPVTCFPAWLVPRSLNLIPYGVHNIDIAVDGTISETPRVRPDILRGEA